MSSRRWTRGFKTDMQPAPKIRVGFPGQCTGCSPKWTRPESYSRHEGLCKAPPNPLSDVVLWTELGMCLSHILMLRAILLGFHIVKHIYNHPLLYKATHLLDVSKAQWEHFVTYLPYMHSSNTITCIARYWSCTWPGKCSVCTWACHRPDVDSKAMPREAMVCPYTSFFGPCGCMFWQSSVNDKLVLHWKQLRQCCCTDPHVVVNHCLFQKQGARHGCIRWPNAYDALMCMACCHWTLSSVHADAALLVHHIHITTVFLHSKCDNDVNMMYYAGFCGRSVETLHKFKHAIWNGLHLC